MIVMMMMMMMVTVLQGSPQCLKSTPTCLACCRSRQVFSAFLLFSLSLKKHLTASRGQNSKTSYLQFLATRFNVKMQNDKKC